MMMFSASSISIILAFVLAQGSMAFIPQKGTKFQPSIEVTEKPTVISSSLEDMTETSSVPALSAMSQSLPFMKRPAMLDGSMAGDVGFDPLGFAKTKDDLLRFREAEIKHGRLAMLAAAGWPLSELFDKKLATLAGLTPILDASDRAPSALNGGLGKISPLYWAACLGFAAAIDLFGVLKSRSGNQEYFPGNLGFDPLGLYPKDGAGQLDMQLKELKNGRLAMIAIVAFAAQEFVQKIGVVDEVPIFFKPLGTVLHEYANSGYIIPN